MTGVTEKLFMCQPDPPIPAFWGKSARIPRKKQGSLYLPNPQNPWKMQEKKEGKLKNEKSEESEKEQGLEGQGNVYVPLPAPKHRSQRGTRRNFRLLSDFGPPGPRGPF